MELVEVNVICLQTLKRILAGFDDVVTGSASIIGQVSDASKHLGCQHNLLTQIVLFQKFSCDPLAITFVVDIGSIEKIDTAIHSLPHNGERIFFGGRPTE